MQRNQFILRSHSKAFWSCFLLVGLGSLFSSDKEQSHQTVQPAPEQRVEIARWAGVTRQAYTYSCGTGAVVNFVTLLGDIAPQEDDLIKMYAEARGSQAAKTVRENGFSLLDLKFLMSSLGYKTTGVRYEAGTMPEESQPMIVHLLLINKISHFAVFAGLENEQVVLLDSIRGRTRLSPEQFFSEWDGTALCLLPETDGPASLPPARSGSPPAKAATQEPVLSH